MDKKNVSAITSRDVDFAQWYTDIVKKAELVDYSSVRGCTYIRPYAWAIWENIQDAFNKMIKSTGHSNMSLPMLIPESLLQKEKDHVEGFAPDVAWVTHGGSEKLEERLCIRPTSETLFCEHFKNITHSWRDLPHLFNQWCSVVRWEKSTRPFLRGREFHWQEGHTLHVDEEDARKETMQILDFYEEILEKYLCIPVLKGKKTDMEKFAGAVDTYTVEAMMYDGKALQSGTSHYIGTGFSKAFEIQYSDKENKLQHPHQTSWGLSTRVIGGIIMTHGDDNGLVLPPLVAPIQVAIVPVAAHKPGVTERAVELGEEIKKAGFRVMVDQRDYSPGWKFAEHEMRGVPIKIELGPRDIEQGQCVLVRRDTLEKQTVNLEGLVAVIQNQLDEYGRNIYDKAKKHLDESTLSASTMEEMADLAKRGNCFVKTLWCGDEACEVKVKDDLGMTSRCMPMDQSNVKGVCPVCGRPAKHHIIYGFSY